MSAETGNRNLDSLKAMAKNAPQEPGVYLWKDEDNRIIYIGKAKVLRSRLQNYFAGSKDIKTAALVRHSRSIETIIVSNEYEALLLENTLIKQHTPKYNINLKDGKSYPVIRISTDEFPKIFRTRRIVEDGSLYFGPYSNIQSVDQMLALIERLFPLRKCKNFSKRSGPCMYYHISRCNAPCCGRITAAEYNAHVEMVKKLLAGETDSLVAELTKKMNEEAAALKFEEAAKLRNAIRAIEEITEPHSVEDRDPEDRDYIAWAAEGIFTAFSVFSMRGGKMTGRDLYCSRSAASEDETMETFITAYYSPDKPPPPRIFLQSGEVPSDLNGAEVSKGSENPSKFETLPFFFNEVFGYAPTLISIEKGASEKRHEAALAMARQNALEELRRRLRERGAGPALDELKNVLGLKNRPERIEGYDISQLDGKHPVASLISFVNGVPDKKNYRHFKLRSVVGIVDDFAAMREVIYRRYSKQIREGNELPDLILVDGGLGQVNAAKGVLNELGLDCDLAGLAKREEEIWLPSATLPSAMLPSATPPAQKPLRLPARSEALKVLQHVRDETHRFATGLNQKLRSKDLRFPALESIDGIGPKRAAAIMKTYTSLAKIAETDPAEIAEQCGISNAAARAARASAKLALEDQAEKKKRLSGKAGSRNRRRAASPHSATKNSTSELAIYAAEDAPEYSEDGE